MQKPTTRRCSECSGIIPWNPMVKERQVTCGEVACQRSRHSEKCRQWHQNNADAKSHHYQDVVVPFRHRHPGYQSYWRWQRRLREIRESLAALIRGQRQRLQRLLRRGQALSDEAQVPETSKEKLLREAQALDAVAALLDQLPALVEALGIPTSP